VPRSTTRAMGVWTPLLAFQPMTPLLYLFARVAAGDTTALDPREVSELGGLRQRFTGVFAEHPGHAEAMLFRLAHAGPASARSLRLPARDVLSIER